MAIAFRILLGMSFQQFADMGKVHNISFIIIQYRFCRHVRRLSTNMGEDANPFKIFVIPRTLPFSVMFFSSCFDGWDAPAQRVAQSTYEVLDVLQPPFFKAKKSYNQQVTVLSNAGCQQRLGKVPLNALT